MFHSGVKPSNHTTRKCHWLTRIAKGDGLLPPRLLGSSLRLRPSSRLSGQSAQYKTNTLKNTEPTWCLPVWPMIDAAGGCSDKR